MSTEKDHLFSPSELSSIRAQLRLTQLEFSQLLGLSRNYLSMMESGRMPVTRKMQARMIAMGIVDANGNVARERGPVWRTQAGSAAVLDAMRHATDEIVMQILNTAVMKRDWPAARALIGELERREAEARAQAKQQQDQPGGKGAQP